MGGFSFFYFHAEDGIRDLVRSHGLGDVYKWQDYSGFEAQPNIRLRWVFREGHTLWGAVSRACLLYTTDAADDLPGLDRGGSLIIKNNNPKTLILRTYLIHLHLRRRTIMATSN